MSLIGSTISSISQYYEIFHTIFDKYIKSLYINKFLHANKLDRFLLLSVSLYYIYICITVLLLFLFHIQRDEMEKNIYLSQQK